MLARIIVVLLVSSVHISLVLAQGQQPKKVARVAYLSHTHLAARMEQLATPDSILITAETLRLVV
jgi:class 3 adenylate cyclase